MFSNLNDNIEREALLAGNTYLSPTVFTMMVILLMILGVKWLRFVGIWNFWQEFKRQNYTSILVSLDNGILFCVGFIEHVKL